MNKKIIAILVVTAILTLACLCIPTAFIPFGNSPVASPPTPTVAPVDAIPVCVQNLAQVLDESAVATAPTRGLRSAGEYPLVVFSANGNRIAYPLYSYIPDNLKVYQEDIDAQAKIWEFITSVIPVDQRMMVTDFVIYTDGAGKSVGEAEQADHPQDWKLEMDIIDGGNFPDLATTVMHEFGHLLTLNESQVTADAAVFENPGNRQIYNWEAATCPNYFSIVGCSHADSYLNTFFNLFWPDLYDKWQAINAETNQQLLDQKLNAFYQEYSDRFVSQYAALSPSEDIAETFKYFIFVPKPSGMTIADQKILFFYNYPTMDALREKILENLCTYVDKP